MIRNHNHAIGVGKPADVPHERQFTVHHDDAVVSESSQMGDAKSYCPVDTATFGFGKETGSVYQGEPADIQGNARSDDSHSKALGRGQNVAGHGAGCRLTLGRRNG